MGKILYTRSSALLAGLLAGIVSPSSIYAKTEYPRLKGSDLSRLRGDASRIGADFYKVINEQKATAQRREAA